MGRQKMSKSVGNVVNPFFALDRFGVDTMRYYLIHDGGIRNDADYENSYIVERYKKGLSGGIGNLTSRVTRGKKWSVRKAVERATSGAASPASGNAAQSFRTLLIDLPDAVSQKFVELDPGAALKIIMNTIYEAGHSPSFPRRAC